MVSCTEATQKYNKLYAELVADSLNARLAEAVAKGDYSGKMFAKGRTEKGSSLSSNERSQGGIFWLRPQEAQAAQLDLGIPQIVGHNPGWDVRGGLWAKRNFIEADVGRRTGGTGVYADTPFMQTVQADILTEPIAGGMPDLSWRIRTGLKLKAMRDTVADVFMGWDGRIQAIDKLKQSDQAVKSLVKSLDEQIEQRLKVGDSIGAAYLGKQKIELISPTGRDYLYGGIGFWRDIVMGRQNSVKVLNNIANAPRTTIAPVIATITNARNRITKMSDYDTNLLFGKSKQEILNSLDTSRIDNSSLTTYRDSATELLKNYRDLIDDGLERSIVTFLDNSKLVKEYGSRLQKELRDIYGRELSYDATRRIDGERYSDRDDRYYYASIPGAERIARVSDIERASRLPSKRTPTVVRQVTTPRTLETPRMPTIPRVPDTLRTPETPEVPEAPRIPEVPRTPDYLPPSPLPVEKVPPPPPIVFPNKGGKESQQEIPVGSIAYKKGLFWKYIPPPYDQPKPITLKRGVSPIGADLSGGNSPYTTVQKIGESDAPVPERIAVDEGITDSFISLQGSKIAYAGKGEQTNVGTRIDSTTVGMSVEGGGAPAKGHAYARKVYPKHSVSRTDMSTEEPVRGRTSIMSGINRPKIAEDTRVMVEKAYEEPEPAPARGQDDFDYEALDELGDVGTFGDEDPNWLRQNNRPKKKKPTNRTQNRRIITRRVGNPTVVRSIKL
jgi:hypothetical protein